MSIVGNEFGEWLDEQVREPAGSGEFRAGGDGR